MQVFSPFAFSVKDHAEFHRPPAIDVSHFQLVRGQMARRLHKFLGPAEISHSRAYSDHTTVF